MAPSLLIINPEKPTGGKKVAKKKTGKKKPGPKKGSKKKTTKKRRSYRYKNPSQTQIEKEMRDAVPIVLAVSGGFAGSRLLVNMVIPQASAYMRALAQAGLGVLVHLILGRMIARPSLTFSAMVGAISSGVLGAADAATGGRWNLADEEIVYIPENIDPYLVSGMRGTSDYRQIDSRVLGDYVPAGATSQAVSRPIQFGDNSIYNKSLIA